MVRIAHFAHAPESHCSFAQPESEDQVKYKMSIYDTFRNRYGNKGTIMDLEYTGLSDCRPAVFMKGKKHQIAIEVLVDATDVRKIIDNSEAYYKANIGVIWVLPFDLNRLSTDRFKMKEYEKLLYFMNNKKLIFWHLKKKAFTIAEFSPAYGNSAEFYDKDQGSMVYYDGRRLKNTFEIKKLTDNIYPENLTRRVSSKRFEMESYRYSLPKSILWKYIQQKRT
jgi:competence CoiA-like predicted nuclease